MRVTRLKIANIRVIEYAEFTFRSGFNLLVGVNGVGKTTVLDALRVLLSAFVKHANGLKTKVESFMTRDIRAGTEALMAECEVRTAVTRHSYVKHSYLIHKPREESAPRAKGVGIPRHQVHDTPAKSSFIGDVPARLTEAPPDGRPLAVLFSTRRSLPSERAPSKAFTLGGIRGAIADAFANRELRLGEFAAWMRTQQELRNERPAAAQSLNAIAKMISKFLPGYSNLRIDDDSPTSLLIDRNGASLKVSQLSDGERGVLALVVDLTRRLSQANPRMADPAAEAEAVVLIDEIDLHLHPKWQRRIPKKLTEAFPKCQFIATTHSPQVIGEIDHDRIQIIKGGQVHSPPHSFGIDSSRVLEELMHAAPRNTAVRELIIRLSDVISGEDFNTGWNLIDELVSYLGENDPEVTHYRTLLEFMESES